MYLFIKLIFQCQEKPLNKLVEVPQSSDSEQESGDEHLNLVLRMRYILIYIFKLFQIDDDYLLKNLIILLNLYIKHH